MSTRVSSRPSFRKLVLVLLLATIMGAASVRAKIDDKTTRIIGGRLARNGEVPYIVSLHGDAQTGLGDNFFCGGSIYSKKIIITAGHCFERMEHLTNFRIIAGTNDHTQAQGAQVIRVKNHVRHPQYNIYANFAYDIALLVLEKELAFNEAVQPIPIASPGSVASGKAKVSGWGIVEARMAQAAQGAMSEKLMTLDDIEIIPRTACEQYYAEIPEKEVFVSEAEAGSTVKGVAPPAETALCAGHVPPGGKDTCLGDSGGPLRCLRNVAGGKPEKYLCGVVSSGYGCGLKLPGAFTDVAQFHDWIVQNAKAMGG